MEPVIFADSLIKTYAQAVKSPGVWGGIKDLFSRKYNYINAVNDITLSVKKGEFLGYIGPNGAGKSTSIKILTGILQATSGDVKVLGLDPFRDRKKYVKQIGVVFGQRTQLWWDIAVIESFNLISKIYGIPDKKFKKNMSYLIDLFSVESLLNTPVRKLSLGERMKCDIIASLLHDPAILFLDEPTIGLDAIAKESIRETLKKLHEDGETTILLTTHDLQEIEELCDRIVVLDKGRIVYDGGLTNIKKFAGFSRKMILDLDSVFSDSDINELSKLNGLVSVNVSSKITEIDYNPEILPVVDLLDNIGNKYKIMDLKISEPGIEQVITALYRKGFAGLNQ